MPVSFFQRLLAVLIAAGLFGAAQEPVKPKLNPRIVTATKQVALFSGLELQLLKAVQNKDRTAVQALLDEDCSFEMPEADPLPGDDWLESVMAKDYVLKAFALREVSVVQLADAAVVKYERRLSAVYKGKAESAQFFVVDVWKKSGETWKLSNRFVSKVKVLPPGAPIKPTGKE